MPLLLMLSLAFVPVDHGLQQGPAAPHLDRDAERQVPWSNRPLVHDLRQRWGPVHLRWDQRLGSPRAVIPSGVSAADRHAFIADIARLAGVAPEDLRLARHTDRGQRQSYHLEQQRSGVPVEGGYLDVFVQAGRIHLVLASLHRGRPVREPLPNEVLVPLERDGHLELHPARRVESDGRVEFLDLHGRRIHAYSTVHYLDLQCEERTVDDPLITVPAREVRVSDGTTELLTDDDGLHGLAGPVDVTLAGTYLDVFDDQVGPDIVQIPGVADDLLDWDSEVAPAVASVQHHFHVARDWLEDRRPDHPWLPDVVPATVRINGSCNAFYSGGTINFYQEGGGCHDFGRIADVIYHEYGHGVHSYVIEAGVFASDVSEGSSDYVAATILDDPTLSPNAFTDGGFIRELETDKSYPEDVVGEVHTDGLIWGSFLWNLRKQWGSTYGEELGWRMVDELFLQALSYGPTLTDLSDAVLAADDDDGDLSNGTPHACELIELLDQHGIGPGAIGFVSLEHAPIRQAGSFDPSYPVSFQLESFDLGCPDMGLDSSSARVFYAVDPPPDATLDDIVFSGVEPVSDGSGGYEAALPRQRAGSEVVYYLSWASADGSEVESSHDGAVTGLHRFIVGDRETLWCDDFESEWDSGWSHGPGLPGEEPDPRWESQWEIGAPTGPDYGADEAASGELVLGTNLEGDGLYSRRTVQHALSPEIDVSGANPWMLLLTAQRWLTVEDALYDQATIHAIEEGAVSQTVWQNPATESGDNHVLDAGWTFAYHDLRGFFSADDPVQLAFSLDTDGGLEYGGWTLDDVCIETLADVPGHYRVRDLQVWRDGDGLSLTWTMPYIDPLVEVVLVRAEGEPPTSPEDGDVVHTATDAAWGSYTVVERPEDDPFADHAYAVFATSEEGSWPYVEVVEGENAVVWDALEPAETEAPEDTGDEIADTADSANPDSTEDSAAPPSTDTGAGEGGKESCGCGTAGGLGSLPLLLWATGAAIGRRRETAPYA